MTVLTNTTSPSEVGGKIAISTNSALAAGLTSLHDTAELEAELTNCMVDGIKCHFKQGTWKSHSKICHKV